MTAKVYIREKNTVSETATNKNCSNIRFKNNDDAVFDDNSPLIKPSMGNNRSYEKWLRLYIGPTGPTGTITNPVFYTDGGNGYGTGITLYVRTTNPGSFSTPVIPSNDSAGTNAFTYTSSAPKELDIANTGPFSSTNTDFGDYLVMWMTLDTSVLSPQRPTGSETFTFVWDET
jgi:hypothetical protein